MESMLFGRTGHRSSRVIFGAAALGSMRQDKADALLPLLLEHGVNHIDTAAMYGDSELRVGAWMDRHRDDFFLATKTHERTAAGARASLERSRERLRSDVIDLIQLHNLVDERDFETALERIVPSDWPWQHVEEGEENAPTHVRAAFMGPSVVVPLRGDGSMALGTWQGIFFCEFDGPRERSVHVSVLA